MRIVKMRGFFWALPCGYDDDGRFREAGGSSSVTGRGAVESVSVGDSDHRDWLSAHSAVRRATISLFCCIFERGRVIHSTRDSADARWWAGGGGAKMALARRGGLLSFLIFLRAFLLNVIKCNQAECTNAATHPTEIKSHHTTWT